ncbi:YihY/virulence factor BrkB family protein [Aureliella helgolandensis]|uniref:Uncharacterized protein n=1 Tax=Aureliella helgolandensis TaxID=2527968 RepID=A0A518GD43_9BACT|nr:YihY/virulence factor BrkB family protein [Aureliella helgolandensis]QDV26503.1 hypothetical protein Q31a_48770 [Aureliella helgolandensis]
MLSTVRKAIEQFSRDDCPTLAASLAYYTLFAMPPLLYLLVSIVSLGMSITYEHDQAVDRARAFMEQQAAQLIGNQAAAQEIGTIIRNSSNPNGTWWKSFLSLAGVLVGATGLLTVLQSSLNRVWRVQPREGAFTKRFLLKRLLSLAMILVFGLLLLISFVVATVLNLLTEYLTQQMGVEGNWPALVNQLVSFASTWLFFAAVFRWMPDALVSWHSALVGGLFTVVLFTLGRWALFTYLSYSNPGQELGSAAASLVVILLWVYYSSLILLFGAEFTFNLNSQLATPENGAERTTPK